MKSLYTMNVNAKKVIRLDAYSSQSNGPPVSHTSHSRTNHWTVGLTLVILLGLSTGVYLNFSPLIVQEIPQKVLHGRRTQILRGDYSTTTWKEEVEASKHAAPVCTLDASTSTKKAPVPVILMSLGRSGSSATWQVLGELTGLATHASELTGSSEQQNQEFFSHIEHHAHGSWALKWLCHEQKKHPEAGIVGFQWKPFGATLLSEQSIGALKMIAESSDPNIKVVRLRRNLLDKTLSAYKHRVGDHVPAHCLIGDEECVRIHTEAMMGLEPSIDFLMEQLYKDYEEEALVDKLLVDMNVSHIQVTYEALYFGDDMADEWMRIFEFLGVGPTNGLTKDDIENAMGLASTGNLPHKEALVNFREVRNALLNTPFEKLLH